MMRGKERKKYKTTNGYYQVDPECEDKEASSSSVSESVVEPAVVSPEEKYMAVAMLHFSSVTSTVAPQSAILFRPPEVQVTGVGET